MKLYPINLNKKKKKKKEKRKKEVLCLKPFFLVVNSYVVLFWDFMIWAIRQELAAKRDGRDGLLAIKAEVVEDNMDVMVNGVVVELGDSEANGKFRLLI